MKKSYIQKKLSVSENSDRRTIITVDNTDYVAYEVPGDGNVFFLDPFHDPDSPSTKTYRMYTVVNRTMVSYTTLRFFAKM